MKTAEEKRAILKKYDKCVLENALKGMSAASNGDIFSLFGRCEEIKKIQLETCNMYAEALNEALNPMSPFSIPVVIAVLRTVLSNIEKKFPYACSIAEDIQADTEWSCKIFTKGEKQS